MKIWIENSSKPVDQISGKSLFCRRLADEMRRRGVDVTDNRDDATDFSLNVIRIKHRRSRYAILRLDGVWHDTAKDFESKNRAIAKSLRDADAVVYQSEFSRNMCEKYLVVADCPSTVIFNGSDPKLYSNIKRANFAI